MPVKGDCESQAIVLARIRERLLEHLLVPQVHPVEHADPQADFASVGMKIGCAMDQLHGFSSRSLHAGKLQKRDHPRAQFIRSQREYFIQWQSVVYVEAS